MEGQKIWYRLPEDSDSGEDSPFLPSSSNSSKTDQDTSIADLASDSRNITLRSTNQQCSTDLILPDTDTSSPFSRRLFGAHSSVELVSDQKKTFTQRPSCRLALVESHSELGLTDLRLPHSDTDHSKSRSTISDCHLRRSTPSPLSSQFSQDSLITTPSQRTTWFGLFEDSCNEFETRFSTESGEELTQHTADSTFVKDLSEHCVQGRYSTGSSIRLTPLGGPALKNNPKLKQYPAHSLLETLDDKNLTQHPASYSQQGDVIQEFTLSDINSQKQNFHSKLLQSLSSCSYDSSTINTVSTAQNSDSKRDKFQQALISYVASDSSRKGDKSVCGNSSESVEFCTPQKSSSSKGSSSCSIASSSSLSQELKFVTQTHPKTVGEITNASVVEPFLKTSKANSDNSDSSGFISRQGGFSVTKQHSLSSEQSSLRSEDLKLTSTPSVTQTRPTKTKPRESLQPVLKTIQETDSQEGLSTNTDSLFRQTIVSGSTEFVKPQNNCHCKKKPGEAAGLSAIKNDTTTTSTTVTKEQSLSGVERLDSSSDSHRSELSRSSHRRAPEGFCENTEIKLPVSEKSSNPTVFVTSSYQTSSLTSSNQTVSVTLDSNQTAVNIRPDEQTCSSQGSIQDSTSMNSPEMDDRKESADQVPNIWVHDSSRESTSLPLSSPRGTQRYTSSDDDWRSETDGTISEVDFGPCSPAQPPHSEGTIGVSHEAVHAALSEVLQDQAVSTLVSEISNDFVSGNLSLDGERSGDSSNVSTDKDDGGIEQEFCGSVSGLYPETYGGFSDVEWNVYTSNESDNNITPRSIASSGDREAPIGGNSSQGISSASVNNNPDAMYSANSSAEGLDNHSLTTSSLANVDMAPYSHPGPSLLEELKSIDPSYREAGSEVLAAGDGQPTDEIVTPPSPSRENTQPSTNVGDIPLPPGKEILVPCEVVVGVCDVQTTKDTSEQQEGQGSAVSMRDDHESADLLDQDILETRVDQNDSTSSESGRGSGSKSASLSEDYNITKNDEMSFYSEFSRENSNVSDIFSNEGKSFTDAELKDRLKQCELEPVSDVSPKNTSKLMGYTSEYISAEEREQLLSHRNLSIPGHVTSSLKDERSTSEMFNVMNKTFASDLSMGTISEQTQSTAQLSPNIALTSESVKENHSDSDPQIPASLHNTAPENGNSIDVHNLSPKENLLALDLTDNSSFFSPPQLSCQREFASSTSTDAGSSISISQNSQVKQPSGQLSDCLSSTQEASQSGPPLSTAAMNQKRRDVIIDDPATSFTGLSDDSQRPSFAVNLDQAASKATQVLVCDKMPTQLSSGLSTLEQDSISPNNIGRSSTPTVESWQPPDLESFVPAMDLDAKGSSSSQMELSAIHDQYERQMNWKPIKLPSSEPAAIQLTVNDNIIRSTEQKALPATTGPSLTVSDPSKTIDSFAESNVTLSRSRWTKPDESAVSNSDEDCRSSDDLSKKVEHLLSNTAHLAAQAPNGDREGSVLENSDSARDLDYASLHRDLDEIQGTLGTPVPSIDLANNTLDSTPPKSTFRSACGTGSPTSLSDLDTSRRKFLWDYGADIGYEDGHGRFIGNIKDLTGTEDGSCSRPQSRQMSSAHSSRTASPKYEHNRTSQTLTGHEESHVSDEITQSFIDPDETLSDGGVEIGQYSSLDQYNARKDLQLISQQRYLSEGRPMDPDGLANRVNQLLQKEDPKKQAGDILRDISAEEKHFLRNMTDIRNSYTGNESDTSSNTTPKISPRKGIEISPRMHKTAPLENYMNSPTLQRILNKSSSLDDLSRNVYGSPKHTGFYEPLPRTSALSNARSLLSGQVEKMSSRNFDHSIELRTPVRQAINCYPVFQTTDENDDKKTDSATNKAAEDDLVRADKDSVERKGDNQPKDDTQSSNGSVSDEVPVGAPHKETARPKPTGSSSVNSHPAVTSAHKAMADSRILRGNLTQAAEFCSPNTPLGRVYTDLKGSPANSDPTSSPSSFSSASPSDSDYTSVRRSKGKPLRPYRPAGCSDVYYTESETDDKMSATDSITTVESTHPGSDDGRAPDFPLHAMGSRQDLPKTAGVYGSRRDQPQPALSLSTIEEKSQTDEKERSVSMESVIAADQAVSNSRSGDPKHDEPSQKVGQGQPADEPSPRTQAILERVDERLQKNSQKDLATASVESNGDNVDNSRKHKSENDNRRRFVCPDNAGEISMVNQYRYARQGERAEIDTRPGERGILQNPERDTRPGERGILQNPERDTRPGERGILQNPERDTRPGERGILQNPVAQSDYPRGNFNRQRECYENQREQLRYQREAVHNAVRETFSEGMNGTGYKRRDGNKMRPASEILKRVSHSEDVLGLSAGVRAHLSPDGSVSEPVFPRSHGGSRVLSKSHDELSFSSTVGGPGSSSLASHAISPPSLYRSPILSQHSASNTPCAYTQKDEINRNMRQHEPDYMSASMRQRLLEYSPLPVEYDEMDYGPSSNNQRPQDYDIAEPRRREAGGRMSQPDRERQYEGHVPRDERRVQFSNSVMAMGENELADFDRAPISRVASLLQDSLQRNTEMNAGIPSDIDKYWKRFQQMQSDSDSSMDTERLNALADLMRNPSKHIVNKYISDRQLERKRREAWVEKEREERRRDDKERKKEMLLAKRLKIVDGSYSETLEESNAYSSERSRDERGMRKVDLSSLKPYQRELSYDSSAVDTLYSIPEDPSIDLGSSLSTSSDAPPQPNTRPARRQRHIIDPNMEKLKTKISKQRLKYEKQKRKEAQRLAKIQRLEQLLAAKKSGRISNRVFEKEVANLSSSTETTTASTETSLSTMRTNEDSTVDFTPLSTERSTEQSGTITPRSTSEDSTLVDMDWISSSPSKLKTDNRKNKSDLPDRQYLYNQEQKRCRKDKSTSPLKPERLRREISNERSSPQRRKKSVDDPPFATQKVQYNRDLSSPKSEKTSNKNTEKKSQDKRVTRDASVMHPSPKKSPTKKKPKAPKMVSEAVQTTPRLSRSISRSPSPSKTRHSTKSNPRHPSKERKEDRKLRHRSASPKPRLSKSAENKPPKKNRRSLNDVDLDRAPGISWFVPMEDPRPWRKPLKERQAYAMSRHPELRQTKSEPIPDWMSHAETMFQRQQKVPLIEGDMMSDVESFMEMYLTKSKQDTAKEKDILEEKTKPLPQMTLQEAFLRYKSDVVSKSRERQKRIALASKERELQELLGAERARLFLDHRYDETVPEYHPLSQNLFRPKKRSMSKQEMRELTAKLYHNLPEVVQKKVEEKRKSEYKVNRIRAKIFNKKVQRKVLGKPSPWYT